LMRLETRRQCLEEYQNKLVLQIKQTFLPLCWHYISIYESLEKELQKEGSKLMKRKWMQ
jgi:hypothetical protein